jgi:hypothetical protein
MSPTAVTTVSVFKKAGVKETAVLLALAWFIPFAVHLAPWSGPRPLGAFLLPMFWAAFVATYFYGGGMGVIVGLFSPALNLLVTGLPAWKFLSVLSSELALSVMFAAWAIRRWPRLFVIAPLSYLAAKVGSTAVQAMTPIFGEIGTPGEFFARSVVGSLPGLVILAAINVAVVWFYPKPARQE